MRMRGDGEHPVSGGAVVAGALVGLAVIVPVSVLLAVVDNQVTDFEDSGWFVAFTLLLLLAYFLAGFRAGTLVPSAPLTNGMLAALCSVAVWIPIRIVVWVVRDGDRGLFSGDDPVLRLGQLFGTAVFAIALGAIGGLAGSRRAAATHTPDPTD